MSATCPACERAVGELAFRCPYCGERMVSSRPRRRASLVLASMALAALAWGVARDCGDSTAPASALEMALAHPASAVCLAAAVMLLTLPLACRPALPGAAGPDALRQTLRDAALSLVLSLGLLLAAALGASPAARLPAGLALLALAALPPLLRRPAYLLLAVPLVLLAWRLAAS